MEHWTSRVGCLTPATTASELELTAVGFAKERSNVCAISYQFGAAAAVMLSAAALAVALMALTKQPPVSSGSIIESPIASAPAKGEPAEYTKSLVRDAIQRYEREGLQATIDYYNRIENVDGAWYVFIVNNYGSPITIAHHNTKLRNRDPSLRIDSTGRFYGDDLLVRRHRGWPVGRVPHRES